MKNGSSLIDLAIKIGLTKAIVYNAISKEKSKDFVQITARQFIRRTGDILSRRQVEYSLDELKKMGYIDIKYDYDARNVRIKLYKILK